LLFMVEMRNSKNNLSPAPWLAAVLQKALLVFVRAGSPRGICGTLCGG